MNKQNSPMIQFIGVDPVEYLKKIVFEVSKNMEKFHREKQAQKEELLTASEAADLLKISASTLKRRTKEGKFRSRRIGNRLRYKKSSLLEEDHLL